MIKTRIMFGILVASTFYSCDFFDNHKEDYVIKGTIKNLVLEEKKTRRSYGRFWIHLNECDNKFLVSKSLYDYRSVKSLLGKYGVGDSIHLTINDSAALNKEIVYLRGVKVDGKKFL